MKFLLTVLLSLLTFGSTIAADAPAKDMATPSVDESVTPHLLMEDSKSGKIKVKLIVRSDTATATVDLVRSYLEREFRKITDIELTDTNPALYIGCLVTDVHTQRNQQGSPNGYTLSFVITDTTTNKWVMSITQNSDIDPKLKELINRLLMKSNSGNVIAHFQVISNKDLLEDDCRKDASIIDGAYVERIRKFYIWLSDNQTKK